MTFIVENIRLKELFLITEQNKPFFEYFEKFVIGKGFSNIHKFIISSEQEKCFYLIYQFLNDPLPAHIKLFDGVAKPYPDDKAKWLFLGWLLRDAPEQRLKPMLKQMKGDNTKKRRARLINIVRSQVGTLLTEEDRWNWTAVSEVMMDRLEGSRRAIKGTLFEAIVRRQLKDVFKRFDISAVVHVNETRIDGETYDVVVSGNNRQVLIPVKTRETMGGGHALLFTRDIHKSISVAALNGYKCLPIVIAESWSGSLQDLDCVDFIYIDKNPNQVGIVEAILVSELEKRIDLFQKLLLK